MEPIDALANCLAAVRDYQESRPPYSAQARAEVVMYALVAIAQELHALNGACTDHVYPDGMRHQND